MTSNWNLFGFELKRTGKEPSSNTQSFVPPQHDDGALVLETGGYSGTALNMEASTRSEVELITRYREMSMQPEIEMAIDNVINEAVVCEDASKPIRINVDELSTSKDVKVKIAKEFDTILRLLNFDAIGHDIFRRWYVDGRLFYNIIIDENKKSEGIQELRYVDPRRIRKVREVQRQRDQRTGAEMVVKTQEYYLYNERGTLGPIVTEGVKISIDSIANVNSGLMDARRAVVLSLLHKAIKPLNQLRMMEDATVIYKVSRAPDRRVFYVDVGNLPKTKAEQYLRNMMDKYRNKITYDSTTGEIRDDRKFISMLEDFWMPRRGESGKGTEIQTLPGGESLANMDNVVYFQKKLYQSLNVPVGRLLPSDGFSMGRTNEITREELAFMKFIDRLRKRFSTIFDQLLGIQLSLKGICTTDEWDLFKEGIWYDFLKDNNFTELKEAEMLNNRIALLTAVDPYVGRYFSVKWVKKNILRQSDEQIEAMSKEIEEDTETQDVGLPPVHPASPFFQPPEGPEAKPGDQPPDVDAKFGQAMDGENHLDSAFGKIKMDEAFQLGVTPKTLNTIKRVLQSRTTQ